MGRIISIFAAAMFCGVSVFAQAQGGMMGGQQQRQSDVQQIDQRIGLYLNGDELKSVLTPGEFVEYKLNIKAGQVLFAGASSDAFDAALEIVDAKNNVLASNDDRYPGDQSPLLLWRCEKDGEYLLHVRCFQNKSGGQVFTQFKTYDSVDVTSDQRVIQEVDTQAPFLARVPMKAGQVKDLVSEFDGPNNFMHYAFNAIIFPNGLPERDPSLGERLSPAINALVAPLDGDYYLLYTPIGRGPGRGKISIRAREFTPTTITAQSKAPNNIPTLWTLHVNPGDLLEVSLPELSPNCIVRLSEAPDFASFSADPKKPESNPFYPRPKDEKPGPGPAFDLLSKRARDNRSVVFRARREATLWLSTNGAGPDKKEFTVHVRPAAVDFPQDKTVTGKLRISDTDYWTFDAGAGDVMSFDTKAAEFTQLIIVRDPDLRELRHDEFGVDQTANNWRMTIQKPGRYLVAVSCYGNGGAGAYSLARKVFHSRDFSPANPAKGELAPGEIQVWKFTATPDKPLLIRWESSSWSYETAIYDDKGNYADFQRSVIDDNTRMGILKVDKPMTFVIVLTGGKDKASYSIQLTPIPSGKKN